MDFDTERRNAAVITDPVATDLTIIRHGHIPSNGSDGPMAGWTDVPLSPRGRVQMEHLSRHLARGRAFDAIYSSPLSRAADTARALSAAGLGPVHFHSGLKEIHCGDVDGMPIGEVQRRFPDLWQENMRQTQEDFRWPGGESYREFRNRCIAAVKAIAAAHLSGHVALVTHAGVISQLVGAIHGLNPARWEAFRPGNASLSELRWRGSQGAVVSFDKRDHLAGCE
jgi:alpha-ribazole phosphatase/probable phosphoglycerate mutase